jgi:hypothetical protein
MIDLIEGRYSAALQMSFDNRTVQRDVPWHGRWNIPRMLRPTLNKIDRCLACWLRQWCPFGNFPAQASSRGPPYRRKDKLHSLPCLQGLTPNTNILAMIFQSKDMEAPWACKIIAQRIHHLEILSAARSSVTNYVYFVDFKTHSWAFGLYKNSFVWRSVTDLIIAL